MQRKINIKSILFKNKEFEIKQINDHENGIKFYLQEEFKDYFPGSIYLNDTYSLENLKIRTLMYDLPERRINEVLEIVDLTNTGTKKAGQFSLGMKQRLGIAMALINNPKLLILDEYLELAVSFFFGVVSSSESCFGPISFAFLFFKGRSS